MNRLIHTLDSGLRAVTEQSSGHVAYIGALTNAGSRDDGQGRDGLAHFVEHTLFKGTASRSNWQISNRMESVGGELNAYTTKEEIMLYANSPAGFEDRAAELISDLICNSTFPPSELDLERGVILEEIHSYHDNASYAVFDEFDELFFKGSGLAHNILGYADTVDRLGTADASGFLAQGFTPANMVVYCLSPMDPERSMKIIERRFSRLDGTATLPTRIPPLVCEPFDEVRERDNHQANTVLGTRIFGVDDPRRYALFVLSNMLGGPAMNSRLNRELRDRRGLVYSVESNVALYSDTGLFQIYFGCEPKNVEKCSRIVKREIARLADSTLSERQFAAARRQICGQLLVSGDSPESCAMSLAKSIMRHGRVLDNADTARRIMELSASDVRDVAETIASAPMSRLVLR